MASKIVLKDGIAAGVYDDRLLPIYRALGVVAVSRASNVEFEGGQWVARSVSTGRVLGSSPDRRDAIKQEIEALERGL